MIFIKKNVVDLSIYYIGKHIWYEKWKLDYVLKHKSYLDFQKKKKKKKRLDYFYSNLSKCGNKSK